MSEVPQQEAGAAILCIRCFGEGRRSELGQDGVRAMRQLRGPARAGLVFHAGSRLIALVKHPHPSSVTSYAVTSVYYFNHSSWLSL